MAEALRQSQVVKTTVDVWFNGSYVATLPVTSGSVTIDRTAATRRQCSITIGDPDFVPTYANSPLAPYGAELRLFQGVTYMDGSDEQVPLGVFRIEEVKWDEATGSLPTVAAFDRSKAVADANFLMPADMSGRSAMFAIKQAVNDVIDCDVLFDPTLKDYTLPGGSVFDSDRWGAVQTMANGMGAEAYFDVYGNLVVTAIPSLTQSTPQSAAVWTVDAGENGVLVSAARGVTRSGVYNAVAAQGVSTDGNGAPPMGFAADTDSRSPTYWGPASALPYGPYVRTPFGQVVYRYTNNLLTTPEMCTTAAIGQLANFLGLARSLDFTCVPNPALDAGDIVLVKYLSGQSELHLLDKINLPLGPGGTFGGSTRTLTYQSSGGS
ncbi:DUF5047 domain-containing protein [Dactylosporangium sp. CA-139066]|uniref:DUF5047 domain-containing protein n=1 Tax=Dactylosporangium sp. CA-139066 TaxID=3239930 RepID=UPI003D8D5495